MIQAVFFPLIRLVMGLVSYQLFKSVAFALRGIPNSSYTVSYTHLNNINAVNKYINFFI